MTSFYGSTAQPKNVFGEGILLDTFYKTLEEECPGAWEINQTMLAIWDNKTLVNEWILPDNFHVRCKVIGTSRQNVHFLNKPYEITYKENKPTKDGRSLGANMVHSIDGMVVREMVARCNFDRLKVAELYQLIKRGAAGRSKHRPQDETVEILWARYLQSGFLSARILKYLDIDNLGLVDRGAIKNLILSLPEKPFEVISIHDCFRCLPNYGNDLRQQYNNILAEIAESDLLSFIISQIMKRKIVINKLNPNLGPVIT